VRLVLDTNTLVSGVITAGGPPRRLIDAVRAEVVQLCSSAHLLAELLDVLSRDKFRTRLAAVDLSPGEIVHDLRRIAVIVAPATVARVVAEDPDDDHVLACAVTGRADLIVTGDRHLINLGAHYNDIPIVTPARAVRIAGEALGRSI
jgi:putative PIN family toxin of toxin-antitoxin system